MSTENSPDITKIIADSIEQVVAELPDLLPESDAVKYAFTAGTLITQVKNINDESEKQIILADLLAIFSDYAFLRVKINTLVYEALGDPIYIETRDILLKSIERIASQMNASLSGAYMTAQICATLLHFQEMERVIFISKGGLQKSTSIKPGNLRVDLSEVGEVIAGLVLSNYGKEVNPLLIVAGVLLIIRGFLKAVSVEISERDSSVFWGTIHARKRDGTAVEHEILKFTNKEREQIGLKSLQQEETINALHKLRLLGCVELVAGQPGVWRLTESYQVQDQGFWRHLTLIFPKERYS